MTAADDPELAAAILESEAEAAANVAGWREDFLDKVERFKLEQDRIADKKAKDNSPGMRFKRFVDSVPSYTPDEAIAGMAKATVQGQGLVHSRTTPRHPARV